MKKSLISIAALGFLSIPALASSTVQTGKVIDAALAAELSRIEGILSQRKLVADDFVDVRPLVQSWVAKLDQMDPAGVAEHGVITEQLENLQAMGIDQKYKMIIDDFGDFRQSMIHTGLTSRIRAYRDSVLASQPASIQPVRDAIAERLQNAIPADPRKAADNIAATKLADDLAKRAGGVPAPAKKRDFNHAIEVINGQRMAQFVGVTLARREAAGRVAPVDFKHVRRLATFRSTVEAEVQYIDQPKELQRLNEAITSVKTAADAVGTSPVAFRWLTAISNDLNMRRSMMYLQRRAVAGAQSNAQFDRLDDLIAIRGSGHFSRTNLDRQLTTDIKTEVSKLRQVAATRPLTKADFTTMQRLRDRLLTNAIEASFRSK